MNGATLRDRLKLVSHFPGRLRVRADTFRVLPEIGAEVAQRLTEEPGVLTATASATTGSLLVTYEPSALQLPELVKLLVTLGGLYGLEVDSARERLEAPRDGQRVRAAFGRVNRSFFGATNGRIDLKVGVPGSLAAGGLALFLAGRRRIPEWYDLLFWAFVTFVNLNPQEKASGQEQ